MSVLDLPLHRPALYNPHLLSKQELIDAFSARQGLLQRLLDNLRATPPGSAPQHHLVVGQRGMGKTMLLRRLRFAIEDDPELAKAWLPLTFPEEQYNVASLSDFWLNCLDALSDLLEHSDEAADSASVDEMVEEIRHVEEEVTRSRLGLDALLAKASSLGRRLVLLVDNADLIFERIGAQDWLLRETLSARPELVLIGASAALIESTFEYGRAFYDFFQVHELEGLNLDETRILLLHTAETRGDEAITNIVEGEPARVKTLHNLTGGNPRTLVLLYNVLATGAEGDVRSDLEQLLDQSTPLYKARFEALPAQAQQVVHALALRWDPTSAGELAEDLRLEVNAVSSQLNRLARLGLVEKVPYDPDTKTGFQIAERFFNIWYLMRASRRVRRRLIWLVEFLRIFYCQEDLRGSALGHLARAGSLPAHERLRYAEFGFALAQACDEPGLRGALETMGLKTLLASDDLRTQLRELIDLEGGDAELRDRAQEMERLRDFVKSWITSHSATPSL